MNTSSCKMSKAHDIAADLYQNKWEYSKCVGPREHYDLALKTIVYPFFKWLLQPNTCEKINTVYSGSVPEYVILKMPLLVLSCFLFDTNTLTLTKRRNQNEVTIAVNTASEPYGALVGNKEKNILSYVSIDNNLRPFLIGKLLSEESINDTDMGVMNNMVSLSQTYAGNRSVNKFDDDIYDPIYDSGRPFIHQVYSLYFVECKLGRAAAMCNNSNDGQWIDLLPNVHNVMLDNNISKAAFTCIQNDASVVYLINKQDNYSSHQKVMHMVIIEAGTLYSATGLVIFNGGSKVCVKPTNAFNRYADGMNEQMYDSAYIDYLCDKEREQQPLFSEIFNQTIQNGPIQAPPTQAPPTQRPPIQAPPTQAPPTQRPSWLASGLATGASRALSNTIVSVVQNTLNNT